MKLIVFAFMLLISVTDVSAQYNGQNTELRRMSNDFVSTTVSDGVSNNEAVDFSITRDTLVIHCSNWVSGETEKNEFVYLCPVKSIGDIELKTSENEGSNVNMINITSNSGLPDFIFKFGSVVSVKQEMARGVSEDDVTVYVTITLPVIADTTKYENLRDVLVSLK